MAFVPYGKFKRASLIKDDGEQYDNEFFRTIEVDDFRGQVEMIFQEPQSGVRLRLVLVRHSVGLVLRLLALAIAIMTR